jgi:hypothetical protein
MCRNLSFGVTTKARACKGAGQEWSPGVTFHVLGNVGECEGMNPHTSKWAFILGVEVPMDSRIFRNNCKGQNPLDWRVPYIIGKILELRCLKWVRMTQLGNWNTSYGQKKGQESNYQFDSRPLKVENHPDFLAWRWRATYCWKVLNESYNFFLKLTSIRGLHKKLWASKVAGVPILGISGLPLGSLETKWHLGAGPVAMHRVYYKGEGGGFPQVWALMNLVSSCLLVVRPCTKGVSVAH